MNRSSSRATSLRAWLQSTSLLAVIAGYSILLLINQRLADWQRLETFRQTSDQVLNALATRSGSASRVDRVMREMIWPGVRVTLTTPELSGLPGPVLMTTDEGSQWLTSTIPLDRIDGSRIHLRIQQNVTRSIQQERLSFWILVVAACTSSLFTSALLRLVLKRGLAEPLRGFSVQLQSITVPPTPGEAIKIGDQPQELQPIADSFNRMQQRLWTSWEQQKIFTDGVAHELRTPITLISGHAQSLLRKDPAVELIPALTMIRSEAERMTSLVSDLLDLARRDSQRLVMNCKAIQADDVCIQLFERMQIKAPGRLQLAPVAENSPEPPIGIGDPDRIQQCLTALVDNALRYGPQNGTISLASSSGPGGVLILHVRDQGAGVREEERERIFERFVRGSAAAISNTRGSGIGLAMVKLLMEAMGGRVVVCDAPGGGADFQLHLQPFKPCNPPL